MFDIDWNRLDKSFSSFDSFWGDFFEDLETVFGFSNETSKGVAIGSPIIPVPGMPTPIAFLMMFPLRPRLISSGCIPKSSVALATASDTAIGSVHPSAGTTSR